MKVSKTIEWDMGHRVTNHHSKCKNLHGHRYVAEICMEGDIIQIEGVSDQGMVIDFGDIKQIAMEQIHDVLDHGFMFWEKDKLVSDFYAVNKDLKHIKVPFVPTSENLSAWIFLTLDKHFNDKYGTNLKLCYVKLWETPKSIAMCTRDDIKDIKI